MAVQKAAQLGPGVDWNTGLLAAAYAAGGNSTEALRLLHDVEERAKRTYVPAYYLAFAYIALGDKNKALAALEKDYEQRSPNFTYLRGDPGLDSLRNEPRFQALLRQMNFGQ